MNVSAKLPDEVRSFRFVKNHHYVALEDADGNKMQLDAATIMLCDCVDAACAQRFAVFTNTGAMVCPHCKGPARGRYVRPQLAFIAESESQFMGWAGVDTPKP